MKKLSFLAAAALIIFSGCGNKNKKTEETMEKSEMQVKVESYAPVTLTTDLSVLSEKEKQMLPIFIEIAQIMDDLFWEQAFGDKTILDTIQDPFVKEFAKINYGPWDRLDNFNAFVSGFGEKPKGANFYPTDMTKEEFEALKDESKTSLYTVIRRNEEGNLVSIPYHEAYKEQLARVDELLGKAIELSDDNPGLKKYLEARRQAFKTDEYYDSDIAWMDMKESLIDFVVGPIENYEDGIFGYKAAYEAFILVKDQNWSNDLAKFTSMLPDLQKELPCDPKYKREVPGTESDLNVYDVIYYAGDCNSGGKTIAINLPNDERVHIKKGTRRLQLKNAMKAKFDNILLPIANLLIDQEQIENVKFDAFFSNVTFHEVAHGLGIKNTLSGKGSVRQALKEQYSAWEEAKADILGLFMVQQLIKKGEITNISVEDAYITFIAGILRSVRFSAADSHGQANMMCFNYFEDKGAFTRTKNGRYHVNIENAKDALNGWAAKILEVEGEGNYEEAKKYCEENGIIRSSLQSDLKKISEAFIPVDVRFEQGLKALGLEK